MQTPSTNSDRRALALYLVIATGIAILLSLYYVTKRHAFAFVDIGSDSFFQFLPYQIAQVRELRSLHMPSWSFNVGPGAYMGFLLDPVQSLAVFFPESWQLAVRLPIYLLKLVLGGAFFFAYLRSIGFERRLAIPGALAYAFSSYAMVNGQWDCHGYEVVQFAGFLYFFESFLSRGGASRVVLAGLFVGSGHVFNLYTFAFLTIVYTLARFAFAPPPNLREHFVRLVQAAFWMLLGIMLFAPVQVPNVYYLLENPRVSGNYSAASTLLQWISTWNSLPIVGSEVAGFFGKDLLGTGSAYLGWGNYFEGPGFYVGILTLMCAPQLLSKNASAQERKLFIVAAVLMTLYIVWPGLRLAVNGFGFGTFRISTLWISAALIVLGLAGLRRILIVGVWRPGLILAIVSMCVTAAVITVLYPQGINVRQLAVSLSFIAVYGVLLWNEHRDPQLAAGLLRTLMVLFCLELFLFALPTMLERTAVGSDGSSQYGSYDDGTQQALGRLKASDLSGEFYRIEKNYNSVFLCDALAQNYAGIKSYFFHGSSLTRFVDHAGLDRVVPSSANYFGSAINRRDVLDLLGVKYLLSHGRELDSYPGVEFVFSEGNISVYRNLKTLGFAHLHDTLLGEAATEHMTPEQRNAAMLHDVIVADPNATAQKLAAMQDSARDSTAVEPSRVRVRRITDSDLDGEVSSGKASVLLVSIPFDPGWTVRLDDIPVTTFAADYGMTALLVTPGTHKLRLTYTPPGFVLAKWLALTSLCILIFAAARSRLYRSRPSKVLRAPAFV